MTLRRDLAESLAAAYLDRRSYHHDLCSGGCSCGFVGLVTELADALLPGFTEAAARLGLEGKPFWAEDYPELLPSLIVSGATA